MTEGINRKDGAKALDLLVVCPRYDTCCFTSGNPKCYSNYTQCEHNQIKTIAQQAEKLEVPIITAGTSLRAIRPNNVYLPA